MAWFNMTSVKRVGPKPGPHRHFPAVPPATPTQPPECGRGLPGASPAVPTRRRRRAATHDCPAVRRRHTSPPPARDRVGRRRDLPKRKHRPPAAIPARLRCCMRAARSNLASREARRFSRPIANPTTTATRLHRRPDLAPDMPQGHRTSCPRRHRRRRTATAPCTKCRRNRHNGLCWHRSCSQGTSQRGSNCRRRPNHWRPNGSRNRSPAPTPRRGCLMHRHTDTLTQKRRHTDLRNLAAESERNLARFGRQVRVKFGRHRPSLADDGQVMTIKYGRKSNRLGPNIGQIGRRSVQFQPNHTRIRQNVSELCWTWPDLLEFGPRPSLRNAQ